MAKKKKKKDRRPRGIVSRASMASSFFQIGSIVPGFISIFLPWWTNEEDSRYTFKWDLWALKGTSQSVTMGDVSTSWSRVCAWSSFDDFCGTWQLIKVFAITMVCLDIISVVTSFIGQCKRDFITLAVAYGLLVVVFICDVLMLVFSVMGTPAGLNKKDAGGGFICLTISLSFALIAMGIATYGLWKFEPVPRDDLDGAPDVTKGYKGYVTPGQQGYAGVAPPAPVGDYGQPAYGYGGYGQQQQMQQPQQAIANGQYPPPQPVGYGQMPQSGGYMQQAPPSGGYMQQAPPSGGYMQQAPPSGGYMQQAPQSGGSGSWPAAQPGYMGNQPVPVQGYGYNMAGAKE